MHIEKREDLGYCGFGKYAMTKWKDLPREYIEFIASDKCHTSDYNKEKARKELQNREKTDGQINFLEDKNANRL
jgi:hypothetical protein